ncbi:hypothetical protein SLE2022_360080 [Rubroshorea leprosula]
MAHHCLAGPGVLISLHLTVEMKKHGWKLVEIRVLYMSKMDVKLMSCSSLAGCHGVMELLIKRVIMAESETATEKEKVTSGHELIRIKWDFESLKS